MSSRATESLKNDNFNIFFIIAVTIFLIFSKKNEPKVFPDKFSKKYLLKYPRI